MNPVKAAWRARASRRLVVGGEPILGSFALVVVVHGSDSARLGDAQLSRCDILATFFRRNH